MKRKLILPAVFTLFGLNVSSQEYVLKMQQPNANYYDIKASFDEYWSTRDRDEKGKGYKAFMRWAEYVEPRVYPTGNLSVLGQAGKNFQDWVAKYNAGQTQTTSKPKGGAGQIASATFTAMGPFGAMSGFAGGQQQKAGRLNFITIDPTNSSNLWVGAPSGGLWKSTNGGTSWSTNTDNLSITGCSDLAIDPNNTNVMYLATGDGEAGDNRSVGVLKTTDGGVTWNTTGLTSPVTSYLLIRRLLVNPNNTQIVLAATNQGIYRTTNGGTSWTVVNNAGCYDLEFKPGNPNVVYAAGSAFRMSTDAGATFTTISSGITTSAGRLAIAVTPADTNYVYVLAGNSGNGGFLGFYRSTTGGTAFTTAYTGTINLLGWSSTGNDSGGQAWYDLCIAASPLDKNEVVTGGVNVWRTTNGGTSFAIYGHWTGSGAAFTHADHHDLEYNSAGTLYDCNDGTVYYRSSTSWVQIAGAMNISQIYRMGMSTLTANKWMTGLQDNGTSMWNGATSTYSACIGGDGMDCFIHKGNDNIVFGEIQYGGLRKSTNGGQSFSSCVAGLPTYDGPWLTVWKQDPQNHDTLYCGYDGLWYSPNLAANWYSLAPLPNTSTDINEFAIAPSNHQVIYVLKNTGIYKTTNSGSTWTTVTNGVPVSSGSPQYICIDPNDEDNAWVVLSGYSAGNKVFMTTNGGATWSNWSSNLPNLPANCCVYHPGSSDRIYVGMDVGIYYRDANSTFWTLYNAGLPNTIVHELEISPASPTKLHAATYGRGVWVADLASLAPAAPVSNFSINAVVKCTNAVLTFSDQSSNTPTSWSWTITPATGYTISSTSAQSPLVTFTSTGVYTVQMQADNTIGPGSISTQTISVQQSPTVTAAASVSSLCTGSPVTFTVSGAPAYTWAPTGGTGTIITVIPSSTAPYTVTGIMNGCRSSYVLPVTILAGPSLSVVGTQTSCAGDPVLLTASGAATYTWSNGAQQPTTIVTPTTGTTFSVNSLASNGCVTTKTTFVLAYALPVFTVSSSDTIICKGDQVYLYGKGASSFTWQPGAVVGYTTGDILQQTTTYTLTGVDQRKCVNVVYFTITADECLELEENNGPVKVEVYPNPGKGEYTLKSSGASEFNVTVRDVAGKLLFQEHVNTSVSDPVKIDLRAFSQGLYFLELSGDGHSSRILRLIKSE